MNELRSLAGGIMLAAGSAAFAQAGQPPQRNDLAANDAAADLGEIVVTARKRVENLRDVPIAITALDQEFLDRANIRTVSDLALQTPGFSFREGFGRTGGGRPAIRGMSNILGGANAAFFVDGIYVSGNITSFQLDNLERVEVIKGPQSALFGRNTFAGAVNFITRKPSNDFEGRLKLSAAQYGQYEASAFVSGPIVPDKLLFEVDGRFFRFGGDYINADSGERDIGGQRSWNTGGKLLWKPTETVDVELRVGYAEDRDKGYGYAFLGSQNLNCLLPTITGISGPPFRAPISSTRARGYFCGELPLPASFAYNNDAIERLGYNGLDRKYFRSSLSLVFTSDAGWSATSITAYNYTRSTVGQDNTLLPSANPSFTVQSRGLRDYSQEVRIASPSTAPVRAILGGYYYRERDLELFDVNVTSGLLGFATPGDGVRNKAVFGLVEADLGERVTVSAEARYQGETIFGVTERFGTAGGAPGAFINPRRAQFDAFLPRVTARFAVTDAVNIYGSVAKGNKPGGFNDLPADASAADITRFQSSGFELFDEETAWNYELGAKGRVGRVNFGVAGFYVDWSRQQLTRSETYTRTNGQLASSPFIQNAGKSEIKGFEFELSGKPSDWLFLRLGYSYTDAKFKRFYDETTEEILDRDGRPSFLPNGQPNPANTDGFGGDVAGNRLPQVPAHQIVASAEVTQPVGEGLNAFVRGDFGYDSKRYVQVDNLAWVGDSYNLNLSAGIEHPRWSFAVWVENALQDKTPLVATRLVDFNRTLLTPNRLTGLNSLTFYRDFTLSAPRKRQVGATATFRF